MLLAPLATLHAVEVPKSAKPNVLIIYVDDMEPMLVNLAADRGEQTDLTGQNPAKKQELQALFDKWNATMLPPRWEDRRWNGEEERKANKQAKKQRRK